MGKIKHFSWQKSYIDVQYISLHTVRTVKTSVSAIASGTVTISHRTWGTISGFSSRSDKTLKTCNRNTQGDVSNCVLRLQVLRVLSDLLENPDMVPHVR